MIDKVVDYMKVKGVAYKTLRDDARRNRVPLRGSRPMLDALCYGANRATRTTRKEEAQPKQRRKSTVRSREPSLTAAPE